MCYVSLYNNNASSSAIRPTHYCLYHGGHVRTEFFFCCTCTPYYFLNAYYTTVIMLQLYWYIFYIRLHWDWRLTILYILHVFPFHTAAAVCGLSPVTTAVVDTLRHSPSRCQVRLSIRVRSVIPGTVSRPEHPFVYYCCCTPYILRIQPQRQYKELLSSHRPVHRPVCSSYSCILSILRIYNKELYAPKKVCLPFFKRRWLLKYTPPIYYLVHRLVPTQYCCMYSSEYRVYVLFFSFSRSSRVDTDWLQLHNTAVHVAVVPRCATAAAAWTFQAPTSTAMGAKQHLQQ